MFSKTGVKIILELVLKLPLFANVEEQLPDRVEEVSRGCHGRVASWHFHAGNFTKMVKTALYILSV